MCLLSLSGIPIRYFSLKGKIGSTTGHQSLFLKRKEELLFVIELIAQYPRSKTVCKG